MVRMRSLHAVGSHITGAPPHTSGPWYMFCVTPQTTPHIATTLVPVLFLAGPADSLSMVKMLCWVGLQPGLFGFLLNGPSGQGDRTGLGTLTGPRVIEAGHAIWKYSFDQEPETLAGLPQTRQGEQIQRTWSLWVVSVGFGLKGGPYSLGP